MLLSVQTTFVNEVEDGELKSALDSFLACKYVVQQEESVFYKDDVVLQGLLNQLQEISTSLENEPVMEKESMENPVTELVC